MAIGTYAGERKLERKGAKDICTRKGREFWPRWISAAPSHCAEIGEGRTGHKVRRRPGKPAAAKIEDLIRPA